MKLKNYLLSMVAVSMLFACSTDEPIDPTAPNAKLSLLTDAGITTKSDESITNIGYAIVYGDGQVVAESTSPTRGFEIIDQPVRGGVASIVMFANIDGATLTKIRAVSGSDMDAKMQQVLAVASELSKEDGSDSQNATGVTMSSKVYKLTFTSGKHHYLGYNAVPTEVKNGFLFENYKTPIPLYRTVSRVQITELALQQDTRYGKASYFKLNYVFLANVKGLTQIGSVKAWDKIAVDPLPLVTDWRYGAYNTAQDNGTYKSIGAGTLDASTLCYTPTDAFELGIVENVTPDKWSWTASQQNGPFLGKSFFVYENQTDTKGERTYLILCGNYKGTDLDGNPVDETNRFWAVPVNYTATTNSSNYATAGIESDVQTELTGHKGIRRNHIYSIKLTLTGQGSKDPYTPDTNINLNAEVEVADWYNVIDVPAVVE